MAEDINPTFLFHYQYAIFFITKHLQGSYIINHYTFYKHIYMCNSHSSFLNYFYILFITEP